jgi:hypothetical protein
MRSRTLVLRKETLTELATEELAAVVGASAYCVGYTKLPTGCNCTGMWPSLNVDCPTTKVTEAIAATLQNCK